MPTVTVQPDVQAIAKVAAETAAKELKEAIAKFGQATWVLAGGTAPMGAYQILATEYKDSVEWDKVYVLLGDERCVPVGHPDSNWHQIAQALLDVITLPDTNKLRPKYELSAEDAAADYEQQLSTLPKTDTGLPRLDHVWIGMGEDGHTLSLFPGHPALQLTDPLVIPVHDSPKPPPDRISLTLKALKGTGSCLIMTAGAGKTEAVTKALSGDDSLPVLQAANTIEAAGGHVTWLLDTEAAKSISK